MSTSGACASEQKTEEQDLAEFREMVAHGVANPSVYQAPTGKTPSYGFTLLQRVSDLRRQVGMVGGRLLILDVGAGSPLEPLKATIDLAKKNGFSEVCFYAGDEASADALRAERAQFAQGRERAGAAAEQARKAQLGLLRMKPDQDSLDDLPRRVVHGHPGPAPGSGPVTGEVLDGRQSAARYAGTGRKECRMFIVIRANAYRKAVCTLPFCGCLLAPMLGLAHTAPVITVSIDRTSGSGAHQMRRAGGLSSRPVA